MSVYVIRNTETREYWSNADGWGSFRTASVFTPKASEVFNLDADGWEWVEWSKQGLKTVDVANVTRTEVDEALHR
jgi:hypothetical protein